MPKCAAKDPPFAIPIGPEYWLGLGLLRISLDVLVGGCQHVNLACVPLPEWPVDLIIEPNSPGQSQTERVIASGDIQLYWAVAPARVTSLGYQSNKFCYLLSELLPLPHTRVNGHESTSTGKVCIEVLDLLFAPFAIAEHDNEVG